MSLYNVADIDTSDLEEYENIIVGCPTWNIGELQSDWDGVYQELDGIDFSGKDFIKQNSTQKLETQFRLWQCPQGGHFFHHFYPDTVGREIIKFWNSLNYNLVAA